MGQWTQGVCGDGVAILRDGIAVSIDEVLRILNDGETSALKTMILNTEISPVQISGVSHLNVDERSGRHWWKYPYIEIFYKDGSKRYIEYGGFDSYYGRRGEGDYRNRQHEKLIKAIAELEEK